MGKNIALFFDGTWNRPREDGGADANTNVRKLFLASEDSARQVARYIDGVGSAGGVIDGAFGGIGGLGVSENICEGYAHLVEHYRPGDHIYLFGFSRGAYTARSLAGFVREVGLLLASHMEHVPEAFRLYKSKARVEDSELFPFLRRVLDRENLEIAPLPVYLIGVWDTVGRLGIPGVLGVISNPAVRFHRTDLPDNVTHGRHALALHELRPQFEPVLWTNYQPPQTLRQVWLPGAHCDVGGGYRDARLSDVALAWMAGEAMFLDRSSNGGLIVNPRKLSPAPDALGPVHHELKKWFACWPSRVRSSVAKRPEQVVETFAVHESARRRCWDPGRVAYRAWRPDVKWRFRTVDALTLQLDLWLLYQRPAPTPGKPAWWAALKPEDVVEVVEKTRELVKQGPLKDGHSTRLEIRASESFSQSLCILFLYAGKQPLRDLIDACDKRFGDAQTELISIRQNEAMLKVRARAWGKLADTFDAALSNARNLLPLTHAKAYDDTVWPSHQVGIGARGALQVLILQLCPPIKSKKSKSP